MAVMPGGGRECEAADIHPDVIPTGQAIHPNELIFLNPLQKQGNDIAKPMRPAGCIENVILYFAKIPIILIGALNTDFIKRTIGQISVCKIDLEPPSRIVQGAYVDSVTMFPFAIA